MRAGRLTRRNQASVADFEWDEVKRLAVLESRGIDFIDVAKILLGWVFEYESRRNNEQRFVAIGPGAGGALIAAIYLVRGQNLRVITARPARKNEQRAYLHAISDSPNEGED